jgi:hypothetical protein
MQQLIGVLTELERSRHAVRYPWHFQHDEGASLTDSACGRLPRRYPALSPDGVLCSKVCLTWLLLLAAGISEISLKDLRNLIPNGYRFKEYAVLFQ